MLLETSRYQSYSADSKKNLKIKKKHIFQLFLYQNDSFPASWACKTSN